MAKEYEDLLDHPYDGVLHHTRMPMNKRAAQFSPFAALTGFEEAINRVSEESQHPQEDDTDGEYWDSDGNYRAGEQDG